eukprot:4016594-Lingulodinium_polyedra.AAC.1
MPYCIPPRARTVFVSKGQRDRRPMRAWPVNKVVFESVVARLFCVYWPAAYRVAAWRVPSTNQAAR